MTADAVSGSGIDGGWFVDVTDFARSTGWLHEFMHLFTQGGVVIAMMLAVLGWWMARHRGTRSMALALAVGVSAVVAAAVSMVVKSGVGEHRPCYAFPHAYLVDGCAGYTDYAFPSNHSIVVGAIAGGLFYVDRRLGWTAVALALLEGFSRVYVGAHYPHDVVAGLVIGAVVSIIVAALTGRYGVPLVHLLRRTPLRLLVTTAADNSGTRAAAHGPQAASTHDTTTR